MNATDRGYIEEIITHLKKVETDYHINLSSEKEWLRGLAKEESVSEDLEEAIEQSFIDHENRGDDFRCDEQIETAYRYGFETGANWQKKKDESYTKSMYKVGINTGKELMKQQMIEKAIDWIKEITNHHHIVRYSDSCEPPLSELTEWFKNYMKEGGKDE